VRDVVLITNGDAGSNEAEALDSAVETLRRHRAVEVVVTDDEAELDGVLDGRDGRDLVVAGGDGSLHAAVAALRRRGELGEPTIGLIPLGTGNDFARGVGLSLDPAEAAEIASTGTPTPIDILVDDEGGIVVNVVHAGVGADAGVDARPWKAKFGKAGYVFGALTAALRSDGVALRVTADDEVVADGSRRVLQVAMGNGTRVGGGFEIAPDADPSDGKLDLIVSFAIKPVERLTYGFHVARGSHHNREDVRAVRASSVTISGDSFCVNTDGEITGPITSRRWQVLPRAFTMLLPPPAPAEEPTSAGRESGQAQ
jgi:diacylglycerol kinase (ATP)